jgi:hypothetical protein
MNGWIGVDLDGTLAYYEAGKWRGIEHIGEPIAPMVERVRRWVEEGREVRIFTARICEDRKRVTEVVHAWLHKQGLPSLAVTNEKDYGMIELWDDRAVQVKMNEGEPVGHSTRGLK